MQTFTDIFNRVCQLGPRNSPVRAAAAADQLSAICRELNLGEMSYESFESRGDTYYNLCVGPVDKLVFTAHYDTTGPTCGACDNSSGVAVAIAAAHLAKDAGIDVGLVLMACEEPPFFAHKMGSQVWVEQHYDRLGATQIIVIDSLGGMYGLGTSEAHPSNRATTERELVLLAPDTDNAWATALGSALSVPNFVDLNGNQIRRLGDTRNMESLRSILLLDSATMSVPFHSPLDIPESVDVTWLEHVAVDLAHLAMSQT